MTLDPDIIIALAGLAAIAGFVDAIAGGGGLLTLPALLLAGLDPLAALATNKLQSSFGSASAAFAFGRAGRIDLKSSLPFIATTFAGACLGVMAVSIVPVGALTAILPVLLIAMAVYFALAPRLSDEDAKARISALAFSAVAGAIGFYDGVFGPGTGSFLMLGFVLLLGYGVLRATAHTKLLNFTSNIASLLMFLAAGKILWAVGLAMGLGQMSGAYAGSHLAMRHGARLIRPLLVVVCCAMALRLVLDPSNPFRAIIAA